MNESLCGVVTAWIATRVTKGWCVPIVGAGHRRLAGALHARRMRLERCTYVGSEGVGMLWGCPFTPGTTQGSIGDPWAPRETSWGYRVVPEPNTNLPRYHGRPRALGEHLWGYRGVP